MNFLKRLISRCDHVWETFAAYDIRERISGAVVRHQYHLRCKKCGDIKVMKVSF